MGVVWWCELREENSDCGEGRRGGCDAECVRKGGVYVVVLFSLPSSVCCVLFCKIVSKRLEKTIAAVGKAVSVFVYVVYLTTVGKTGVCDVLCRSAACNWWCITCAFNYQCSCGCELTVTPSSCDLSIRDSYLEELGVIIVYEFMSSSRVLMESLLVSAGTSF